MHVRQRFLTQQAELYTYTRTRVLAEKQFVSCLSN